MDKETIFNIFPIFENQLLLRIGFRVHEMVGTDEKKLEFLLSRVESDQGQMMFINISDNFKVKLPNGTEVNGLTHERFNMLQNNGTEGILYEPIYKSFNAVTNPLSVSTPIADGKIKFDRKRKFLAKTKAPFTEQLHEEIPNYYLAEFLSDEGFDLVGLIDKDFFSAIRILFNSGHFVSSTKLLMSTIDSIAFLEFGDISNKVLFKEWLNKYCELTKLRVSADELWEYRNSILHMTNSYSRKVINKQVSQIQFYVSSTTESDLTGTGEAKYFNLDTLVSIVSDGVSNWSDSFNHNRNKFADFADRYDLIVSDNRYSKISR